MDSISKDHSIPIRREKLPWREIDGRAVVIQPFSGEVHELDNVATFLWLQLDGETTVQEIRDRLCRNFEVTPEVAAKDTQDFLESLESLSLITWAPRAGSS